MGVEGVELQTSFCFSSSHLSCHGMLGGACGLGFGVEGCAGEWKRDGNYPILGLAHIIWIWL